MLLPLCQLAETSSPDRLSGWRTGNHLWDVHQPWSRCVLYECFFGCECFSWFSGCFCCSRRDVRNMTPPRRDYEPMPRSRGFGMSDITNATVQLLNYTAMLPSLPPPISQFPIILLP